MNKEQIEIVNLIKENPYKIAQLVGFCDVRKFPHNDWMKNIICGSDDYTLLAHRGSYKSSCLSVCIALMMVFYPDENIIFLRKTDNDVSEMIRMVIKALNSEIIQDISMVLYKKRIIFKEMSQSAITTNLFCSASGSSQLLGIGLRSSITGKHAPLVITDDICNVSDRISKAERDRTKIQYQELQNIKNRGGRIINLGTKWHKDDVFELMCNHHIYDYKQTKLISEKKIIEIKNSMTAALFACNYELKIIADEDVIFDNPKINEDFKLVLNGIAHVDAAYGGEDYTAFTVCKKHDDKYYIFGKLWHKHVDECLDEIKLYMTETRANKIYCEDNGDRGYLAKELRKKDLRAITYHENQNKFLKITSYLKGAWENVRFVTGTDKTYINQICEFNENAEHDDAPDSLSTIVRKLYTKKVEPFESVLGLI